MNSFLISSIWALILSSMFCVSRSLKVCLSSGALHFLHWDRLGSLSVEHFWFGQVLNSIRVGCCPASSFSLRAT